MKCSCRVCGRKGLRRDELAKDDAVYRGICKKCVSKREACTALLKRVELAPFRYKSCTDCDKFMAKNRIKCRDCGGTNFEDVE